MKDMTVSKALKWIFIAQILGILVFIPIVGLILAIVGFVMNLLALYGASKIEGGYHTAFILSIVGIVVSVITAFAGTGVLASILDIISSIISLAILYYVIHTTNGLLNNAGASEIALKGERVWKLNLICIIASVVLSVLAIIVPVLSVILLVIVGIVTIVAAILYMIYLYKSCNAL